MAKIFLSHSSIDKPFVEWLGKQLTEFGHTVWLDKWEIKVGDCIVTEIQNGIADCDYIVIILTPDAVNSKWVDNEWKAKYWKDIQSEKKSILPILLKQCNIPTLLGNLHYADFTKAENHPSAFAKLVMSISPVTNVQSDKKAITSLPTSDTSISELLSRLGARKENLSQIIPDILTYAHKSKNKELEEFCKGELTGWQNIKRGKGKRTISHRLNEAYATLFPINTSYIGWNGNIQNAFTMMRNNPDKYKPVKFLMQYSVAQLESYNTVPKNNSILSVTIPLQQYMGKKTGVDPNAIVTVYMKEDVYDILLDSIRQRLTTLLVNLLPKIQD